MNRKASGAAFILALAALGGCGHQASVGTPTTPQAKADLMIAQISGLLGDGAFDQADGEFADLMALKPSLPPEYGPKIDKVKQSIDTARAKARK